MKFEYMTGTIVFLSICYVTNWANLVLTGFISTVILYIPLKIVFLSKWHFAFCPWKIPNTKIVTKKWRHSSLFALEWKFFFLVTSKTLVRFMTSAVTFVTKGFSAKKMSVSENFWSSLVNKVQIANNNYKWKHWQFMRTFELTTFCIGNARFSF